MSETQYIKIEKLWVEELSLPAAAEIHYLPPVSVGEDWHYQLYANGILSDISENASQRSFLAHAQGYPQIFAVLAVPPTCRTVDFSAMLDNGARNPSWVCRFRMTQDAAFLPGDRVEIYHDGATGQMNKSPSLRWQVWPPATAHTGWGNSTLTGGGFGIDGGNAPGMSAPFGIGPMGLGGYELQAALPLCSSGEHIIQIFSRSVDGALSTPQELIFNSSAPSARTGRIDFLSHNIYSRLAKFRLNETR